MESSGCLLGGPWGGSLGASWGIHGWSWRVLGGSWSTLGRFLDVSWRSLGALGEDRGGPRRGPGGPWGPHKSIRNLKRNLDAKFSTFFDHGEASDALYRVPSTLYLEYVKVEEKQCSVESSKTSPMKLNELEKK